MGGFTKKLRTYPHQCLHPSLHATMFSVVGDVKLSNPILWWDPLPFFNATTDHRTCKEWWTEWQLTPASFLLPDVCTATASEENSAIGPENGHSHCAHRPVQHSKVGGATLTCHMECFTYLSRKSPPKTFVTGRPSQKIPLKVIGWAFCPSQSGQIRFFTSSWATF